MLIENTYKKQSDGVLLWKQNVYLKKGILAYSVKDLSSHSLDNQCMIT